MKKQYEDRSYQVECWQKLAEARRDGLSKGLIVVASSLGKTFISIRDVEQFWQEYGYGRVLFICHSNPILDQAKTDFQAYYGEECGYGFYTGLVKSNIPVTFLFATFQSLAGHLEEFGKDEFGYIIVDEAHHAPADTYQPIIEYFQPKFLLGMTATPDRLDRKSIEEVFGSPIFELPMAKALIDGWIATIEYNLILDEMEEIGFYLDGEQKITKKELNRKVFMPKRDEEIIRLIKQYASEWRENPQTIIYCKNIVHAKKIAELYDGAEAITSELEAERNREIITRFKSGALRTIVSVEMLNEGVNIPSVDVIVFLRNTTSPRIFWQQLNRGTRKTATKTTVKVLDFVANVERMELAFAAQKEIKDTLKNQQSEGRGKSKTLSVADLFSIDIPTPQFKGRVYDIEELLQRISENAPRAWTKDELISVLQDLAKKFKRQPYTSDLGKDGLPCRKTFIRAFGSWKNALEAADIKIEFERGYASERLLQDIRDLATELGRTPTIRDASAKRNMASQKVYIQTFGSWNDALELAGFTINMSKEKITDEELAQYLGNYIDSLGHVPTTREYQEATEVKYSLYVYINHFKSWKNALKHARPHLQRGYKCHITDDELITDLRKFTVELGRLPRRKEVNENKMLASANTYIRRLGPKWKDVLQNTSAIDLITKEGTDN